VAVVSVERFVVDADRLLAADGETIELFWRGVNSGSSKWRHHVAHVGADLSLRRGGDRVHVKIGDRMTGGVAGDITFDIPVERADELQAFLVGHGIQPT
jgi:hypothetical protein